MTTSVTFNGRGERIRTSDLFIPNEARYHCATLRLNPALIRQIISLLHRNVDFGVLNAGLERLQLPKDSDHLPLGVTFALHPSILLRPYNYRILSFQLVLF